MDRKLVVCHQLHSNFHEMFFLFSVVSVEFESGWK